MSAPLFSLGDARDGYAIFIPWANGYVQLNFSSKAQQLLVELGNILHSPDFRRLWLVYMHKEFAHSFVITPDRLPIVIGPQFPEGTDSGDWGLRTAASRGAPINVDADGLVTA